MSISRKKAWAHAEGLFEAPKRAMPITLKHGKQGFSLLHKGRLVSRCYASKTGKMCAPFVASALGVELPPQGEQAQATVSSGVLYRVISIASLDLRIPEAHILLERLLEEAEFQRNVRSEAIE